MQVQPQTQAVIHVPEANQADYVEGQMDGQRYYAGGHTELWAKYRTGTVWYQDGFRSQKDVVDFAT